MRLGDDDRWVELEIVGYESDAMPDADEEDYDLDTDWLVLRADLSDGSRQRSYGGISLDVEDCVRLIDWLTVVAGHGGEADPNGDEYVTFTEPDLAAQVVHRSAGRVTIQWVLLDERSRDPMPSYFGSYNAATFDVPTTATDIATAGQKLKGSLRSLVDQRIATLRASGNGVGPSPLLD